LAALSALDAARIAIFAMTLYLIFFDRAQIGPETPWLIVQLDRSLSTKFNEIGVGFFNRVS